MAAGAGAGAAGAGAGVTRAGRETSARPAEATRRFRRDSLVTVVSTGAVGVGNYGFALALVWVLPPRDFAVTASVSTLILVAATAANSALPWALAREVSRHPPASPARREAVGFVLCASLLTGLVAAGVVVALSSPYASTGVMAAAAWAVLAVFVIQVSGGHMQGSGRFVLLAGLGVVEVALKLGFGLGLAAAGGGAAGAVSGAALAATAWAAVGILYLRGEIGLPRRAAGRELWTLSRGIGTVQAGVVLLTTLDVVVGSIVEHGSRAMAGYQAMLVFARVPFFVAGAVSAVAYPRLTAARAQATAVVSEGMSLYLALSVAAAAAVATAPSRLIRFVLPSAYASDTRLLLPLALAGLSAGQINLLTTFFQAEDRFAQVARLVWPAVPAAAVLFALVGRSPGSLAWASAGADGAVAVVLTVAAGRRYRRAGVAGRSAAWALAAVVWGGVLYGARGMLPLWLSLAVLGALGIQVAAQRHRLVGGSQTTAPPCP